MKSWSGRFSKDISRDTEEFNSSIGYDYRMYKEDIEGSIAYAKMLAMQGIIPGEDSEKIIKGLRDILDKAEKGEIGFTSEAEDIHMNIESILVGMIGESGKKLHTARSRNDQVATDIRMYLRNELKTISSLIRELSYELIETAKHNLDAIMPGYTHMQRAQPVTLAHHMMAYVFMFIRDLDRIGDAVKRMNVMPLGSGALSTSSYPLDRASLKCSLGFDDISHNSLDAVSDRDFCIEVSSALAIVMMHLSRFGEEIVLWASDEFSFIELDDSYSTGSSMMPQKKNPDIAELVRGKTGRVYGNLVALLTIMKGLPLAYNKDMQEDKEAIFDSIDTVRKCLPVFTKMLATAKFNVEAMADSAGKGYMNATDLADYLAGKGIPFRTAHETAGKMVAYCISENIPLAEMTLDKMKSFSPVISSDIFDYIDIGNCVRRRDLEGGPSPASVTDAVMIAEEKLKKTYGL